MFGTGTVPVGGNAKMFQKLLKKYGHLVNPLFVNLYLVRDCRYDDMTYRVFAIPVNSESIDDETLRSIKDVVNSLPVGSIRYNAAASGTGIYNLRMAQASILKMRRIPMTLWLSATIMTVSSYSLWLCSMARSQSLTVIMRYLVNGTAAGSGHGLIIRFFR